MGASFKDHFSGHAASYAAARPDYPPELFSWLAGQSPAHTLAWDCATGNGQAARALAGHFKHVIATDASAEQIAQAVPQPGIEYRIAAAESPGLDPKSADLVTVAQAVHWFDRPRFYEAAHRILRPGGLIAVWSYGLFVIDPALDDIVNRFYDGVIGPYWPPERELVDAHYTTLDFPFEEITPPAFVMERDWTRDQVLAYLRTWSAVQRYRHDTGHDPVSLISEAFTRRWGDAARRRVHWPLYLRAGRPG